MYRMRSVVLLLLGFFCTAFFAESVAQVPEALRACVSQEDDSRRLSCYDQEISKIGNQADVKQADMRQAGVAASLPPAAAVVVAAEDSFGLRRDIAQEEADRQKVEQLQGKIIHMVSRPRGERVLTLDNNQVWAQKTLDLAMRFKVGDEVTIKRGAFGSFLLFHSGRSTLVTRVK